MCVSNLTVLLHMGAQCSKHVRSCKWSCLVNILKCAFKISKVGLHFVPWNQNQNRFLNSAKSILYKSVVQIEWCRSKFYRISRLSVILAWTRVDVNTCVSIYKHRISFYRDILIGGVLKIVKTSNFLGVHMGTSWKKLNSWQYWIIIP